MKGAPGRSISVHVALPAGKAISTGYNFTQVDAALDLNEVKS